MGGTDPVPASGSETAMAHQPVTPALQHAAALTYARRISGPAACGLLLLAENLPALPALRVLSAAGRDLLARTAELPGSETELLEVLTEYRHAVFAFTAVTDKL